MVKVKMPDVTPIISYVLMGLTIVTFILQFGSEYLLGVDVLALAGAKVNELILQGQVWRFFTPMLLHGSILHLGFNMYALYIFGPGLERFYGRWRFLLLYILSGFAGNVMSFLFTSAPSLGSSTAIFGLLGAEGVFLYQNRSIFGRPAQRALGNIILIAVVNLMIGLSPGIDNWGHIGGLLAGTLFAWYAGPALQVEGSYPNLALVDRRSTSDVVRTALGVGVLFTSLAAVTIILRI
jgi:rhomboid protease GluP